ncbi:hypothetical protein QUG02_19815 [Bacillus hominis]|uniref:Uncharacterized protein n=1 Tax=Bacillus hominis TaxID=2817478 RepID=A0ABT7RBK2_9BACI|nr:hypothetical protein [Bacillus hominis]EJQ48845.1 hypothetical protein IEQ_03517 [Bacillus cereus BAG6X1-2]MDM5195157.1 hypothetical protein [Bacillus hominis]MDM5434865.1 hypothetical protein [Bacillus hominis]MDM5440315.1 hypothetical protein [Bacillus hominis]
MECVGLCIAVAYLLKVKKWVYVKGVMDINPSFLDRRENPVMH